MASELNDIETMHGSLVGWLRASPVVGIELPDGWFGRPYDNQHRLTSTAMLARRIVLSFDDRFVIMFVHPSSVMGGEDALVVLGSREIVWTWDSPDSETSQLKTYDGGEVRFHAIR